MKITHHYLKPILITFFVLFTHTVSAGNWFGFGGGDEEIIWEGKVNNYFKYVDQDDSKFGKNDHPIEVEEKDLINVLSSLEYTSTSMLGAVSLNPVFSYTQIRMLAEYLSKGLSKAKPDRDIIYAIGGSSKKVLVLTRKSYTTGRVFYKEGKLNIIIGEYDFARNDAMEKELDPSGRGDINYNFNHGKRTKKSNNFKYDIVGISGITQKAIKNKRRPDWLEIDVKIAAEAYVARKEAKENPQRQESQALKNEAAKLARQRREMRAEMARMRKDMDKKNNAAPTTRTIEDRISTLDDLLAKELISKEEYAAKRKEILNDI